jgi:thiol-disulfide isomerase/thioredoxin
VEQLVNAFQIAIINVHALAVNISFNNPVRMLYNYVQLNIIEFDTFFFTTYGLNLKLMLSILLKKMYFLFAFLNIVLLIFMPLKGNSQSKSEGFYKLTAVLKNAPFDSLYFYDYTNQINTFIEGQREATYKWTFHIPDSLVQNMETAVLVSSKFDRKTRSSTWLSFILKNDNQEDIKISNIGLEDRDNYIYAIYRDSSVYNDNTPIKINGIDTVVPSILVNENFYLQENDENSDIIIRAKDPYFCWFFNIENKEKTYDEYLDSYLRIATKYPYSRFLMTYLSSNLQNFKTRGDVRKIFDVLSFKHKSSKWGVRVSNFLSDEFKNMELLSSVNLKKEKIVSDSIKYNLVIFTASWCKPCIEEIPLLKSIYKNVQDKVIFTYVNLDNESGVKNFKQIIKRHEIPWRSLYAYNDLTKVINLYVANAIPLNLLVSPDGSYERIDVRKKEDVKKIYLSIGLTDIPTEQ